MGVVSFSTRNKFSFSHCNVLTSLVFISQSKYFSISLLHVPQLYQTWVWCAHFFFRHNFSILQHVCHTAWTLFIFCTVSCSLLVVIVIHLISSLCLGVCVSLSDHFISCFLVSGFFFIIIFSFFSQWTILFLLMCLEHWNRSLEHLEDYIFLTNLWNFPDDCLCTFLYAILNTATKEQLFG